MRIGVIGVGKMGGSFVERLIGMDEIEVINIHDKYRSKMERFVKMEKVRVSKDLKDLFEMSEIIFLAVKPQDFGGVADELKGVNKDGKILISTMAGVCIERMRKKLGMDKITRIMPNLAVKYGKSVVACSFSDGLDENEKEKIKKILRRFGEVIEMDEKMFSAFTAIVGSGPAVVFIFLESIMDSAIRMGFDYESSKRMAVGMVEGAMEVMKNLNLHPGELKNMVTSPAGTTIEGVYELEKGCFRGTIMEAFDAMRRRADELLEDE